MSKSIVLGTEIDSISFAGAIEHALGCLKERNGAYVVTPNAEIILKARNNEALRTAIRCAELSLPDGVGVEIAAHILGIPIRERIAGIDFAEALFRRLSEQEGSIFLLGARSGVAERAAEALKMRYSGLTIVGTENGYFKAEDNDALIRKINAASPDLLLVCLGAPRQELWMRKNAASLQVGLMAGLGGALDVFSGKLRRAPPQWRELGLEWLYRLIQEPKRIIRIFKLPEIIFLALWYRIGGNGLSWETES